VGPIWAGGKQNEPELLASCYKNSLRIAKEKQLKTIAFPAISTGVYSFPLEFATSIAVQTVNDFLVNDQDLEKVIFVCFDSLTHKCYCNYIQSL
jgi:O-acetyl-ADP-ribose deacetylase (regulator of RNase III)